MRSEATLPPAILLGVDEPIGLTIIRELGEHGVPVHAVARSRDGIGLYSRWTTGRYVRPPSEDGIIELLNRVAADQRAGAGHMAAPGRPGAGESTRGSGFPVRPQMEQSGKHRKRPRRPRHPFSQGRILP